MLALDEPSLGAPFPIRWRGRLITQDLANTALEVASVRELLAGRSPRHVIEIGAGYGRTAHAILSIYPEASYTVVDIEPALQISRWYLTSLFPGREIVHIDAAVGRPTTRSGCLQMLPRVANAGTRRATASAFEPCSKPGP